MTTAAKIGHGTLFEIGFGAALTVVGEVTSITPPNLSRDAIDATHTESPEKWREFIKGLKDAGEITIELNWVPGSISDDLLRAHFDSDLASQCRFTLPSAGSPTETLTCDAIVTGYEPEAPVDDKMTATLTLKVTGKPIYT